MSDPVAPSSKRQLRHETQEMRNVVGNHPANQRSSSTRPCPSGRSERQAMCLFRGGRIWLAVPRTDHPSQHTSSSPQPLSPPLHLLPPHSHSHLPWPVVFILEVCLLCLAFSSHSQTYNLYQYAELPPDARADDVSKLFDGFGRIVDCRVMTG